MSITLDVLVEKKIIMSKSMCFPEKTDKKNESLIQKQFEKGEYIYKTYDRADKIFFINYGRVKTGVYGESGKEFTKFILSENEIFGELALVGERRRTDFAFAMEKTNVGIMSVKQMRKVMQEDKNLCSFVMETLGTRVLEMERRLESFVFKDSRARIIEFVADLTRKRGQRVGYEMLVRKFLTHREIANITATSRQTVTTVLNELRNKNILTFNRKRLLIRDVDLLHAEIKT